MVRDVLSIHVSIVASESSFSSGGRVSSPYRCSLTPQMVEMFGCTQDWAKRTSSPLPSNENEKFWSLRELKKVKDCLIFLLYI